MEESQSVERVFDTRPAWLIEDIQSMQNIRDERFAENFRHILAQSNTMKPVNNSKSIIDRKRGKRNNDIYSMYSNFNVERERSSVGVTFGESLITLNLKKRREKLSQIAQYVMQRKISFERPQFVQSFLNSNSSNSVYSFSSAVRSPTRPSIPKSSKIVIQRKASQLKVSGEQSTSTISEEVIKDSDSSESLNIFDAKNRHKCIVISLVFLLKLKSVYRMHRKMELETIIIPSAIAIQRFWRSHRRKTKRTFTFPKPFTFFQRSFPYLLRN